MNKYVSFLKSIFFHDHSSHTHVPGEACSHSDSSSNHSHTHNAEHSPASSAHGLEKSFKKVLIIALTLNLMMFVVQILAGSVSQSSTVLADAADFLSDSFNYIVSIFVIGAGPLIVYRANVVKILSMLLVAFSVLAYSIYKIIYLNTVPHTDLMYLSGVIAFLVNFFCVYLLSRYKSDPNMHAAWACSINDMAGNLLILIVAFLSSIFNSFIPDIIVGIFLCSMTIITSFAIWKKTKNII